MKYTIGKSVLAVNLLLILFRVTDANADIQSLKSIHTFHMLVKYEHTNF